MIIDIHAHALSENFLRDLAARPIGALSTEVDGNGGFRLRQGASAMSLDPNLHDLSKRLESLRRRKVELQLVAPPPQLVAWPGGAADVALTRALHRQSGELAAEAGGFLEPMAVPALGEPAAAAEELRRAVDEHGFRSVTLPTAAGERMLDDPVFEPLWSAIEELGLLAFMHPTSAVANDRFAIERMHVLVGWPFETTLAITRMIFAGVMERHPGLKLILAHGGGNLVFLRGRLNAAQEAQAWERHSYYHRIPHPPSWYLDRLLYDTCVLDGASLRFLIEIMGADRVLFGSDYPFEVGDREGARAMPTLEALPADAREKILRGNAARLLTPAPPATGRDAP